MNWILPAASFFVLWWVVLFTMLPWALRTEDDEKHAMLGEMPGAPHRPRMLRALLLTTVISACLMAGYYVVTDFYGFSFEDIPRVVPEITDR